MHMIGFSHTRSESYCFRLHRWHHFALVLVIALVLVAGLSALAYYLGSQRGNEPIIARWQHDVAEQRVQVERAREETEAHVNALAQRLGLLQAHVNRLDALGNRLVQTAGLDEDEFNFSAAPGLGGPPQADAESALVSTAIETALDRLAGRLADRETQLKVLGQLIISHKVHDAVQPSGLPVDKGWLSSRYGKRTDPFSGKKEFHKGMDFAGRRGSDVIAVASGIVTWAGPRAGYGKLVEIDHGNQLVTRYGHNAKVTVQVGARVKKGQLIAKIGSSGRSTGPHLHFEVLENGKHVNPAKYLSAAK